MTFWRGVPQKREAGLVVLDLDSAKEARALATVSEPEVVQGSAAWSPDGKTIAMLLLRPRPTSKLRRLLRRRERQPARFPGAAADDPREPGAGDPDGRGLVANGQDLSSSVNDRVFLIGHPDASVQRVTNDFNRYLGVWSRAARR